MTGMNPTALQCENVPKPLHESAPREFFGRKWWDETRKKAYESTNYHCYACGVSKEEAFKKQLHAHEFYDIDYAKGQVTVRAIIPLCPTCHDFIHSGRLRNLCIEGKYQWSTGKLIIERGCNLLMSEGLVPAISTIGNVKQTPEWEIDPDIQEWLYSHDREIEVMAPWNAWHFLINGREYYGKFKTYTEWCNRYGVDPDPDSVWYDGLRDPEIPLF